MSVEGLLYSAVIVLGGIIGPGCLVILRDLKKEIQECKIDRKDMMERIVILEHANGELITYRRCPIEICPYKPSKT